MGVTIRTTRKLLIVYYLITLHIAVVFFVTENIAERYSIVPDPIARGNDPPSIEEDQHTAANGDSDGATPLAISSPTAQPTAAVVPAPDPAGLIIPVAGVSREQLIDSFADSRSEGRVHDAIDIPAPAGTPVIAAADGKIIKFFESEAGGTTIYQLSADSKFVYYYAHLQRRADDIKVDDDVKQGRTIGFVGDTGNAGSGNYHLHFSIMAAPDPKRYWEGVYINPYPLLMR